MSEFFGGELAEILDIQPGSLEGKTNEDLAVEFRLEQANAKHSAIRQAMGTMLFDARDCGRLLLEAKRLCRHGGWGRTLAECFEGSSREAQRYMQIARDWAVLEPVVLANSDAAPKNDTVSFLSLRGALALLAEPREAPQLPPAPEIEVIDAEVVEPDSVGCIREAMHQAQEPEGPKRLDNPEAHNEHYTPYRILEAVYACLWEVDLDPCCNPGEPNVKAAAHYRREDDGLRRTWRGRVFANPPYSPTGELGRWTEWLLRQYREGSVTEAIYLVPAYTDTQWWYELRDFPVCLIRGRLTFKGNADAARFPSAVFYLGRNEGAFRDAFAHLGDFWMRTLLED